MKTAPILTLGKAGGTGGDWVASKEMLPGLLSGKIEKETVKGALLGALIAGAVGAFFTEPLKDFSQWVITSIQSSFESREIVITFPSGSDFDASSIQVAVIPSGELATSYARVPLEDFRAHRFFESELPEGILDVEFEIVTSYEWQYVTYVHYSPPIRHQGGSLTYETPEIGLRNYHMVPTYSEQPSLLALPASNFQNVGHDWLKFAESENGVSESSGQGKERIALYLESVGLGNFDYTIPWGCAFIGWAIRSAAINPPDSSELCINWRQFGLEIDGPAIGAVANISPILPESKTGVVGLVTGFDDNSVTLLTGNIKDAVGEVTISRDRIIGYRWPKQ